MKKKLIYFILIIVIALTILTIFIISKKENTKIIFENNKEISVEIADSYAERENGLMFRKNLDKDKGMFFIFEDSAIRNFWMKNTYIPLDIIFIDENFAIVNIAENAQPCINEPCQTYSSLKPAKYVLEVNAGFSEENGIREGEKIIQPKT